MKRPTITGGPFHLGGPRTPPEYTKTNIASASLFFVLGLFLAALKRAALHAFKLQHSPDFATRPFTERDRISRPPPPEDETARHHWRAASLGGPRTPPEYTKTNRCVRFTLLRPGTFSCSAVGCADWG